MSALEGSEGGLFVAYVVYGRSRADEGAPDKVGHGNREVEHGNSQINSVPGISPVVTPEYILYLVLLGWMRGLVVGCKSLVDSFEFLVFGLLANHKPD